MAPKIKVSREEILNAAVGIVREKGAEAVNARSVAAKLDCSIQPIFRTFGTMDELRAAVYKRAEEIYNAVMGDALENSGEGFRAMGMAYVNFAKAESNLFKFLFMSNVFNKSSAADIAGTTEGDDRVIASICGMTNLNEFASQELYTGMWFITHGMASLLATNECTLNDEEIKTMLNRTYEGLLYSIKKERE